MMKKNRILCPVHGVSPVFRQNHTVWRDNAGTPYAGQLYVSKVKKNLATPFTTQGKMTL
jgi:hypothetical protein